MNHVKRYLKERPELRLLSRSPDKRLLKWADKHGYIVLTEAVGAVFYTDADLRIAKMWADKESWSPDTK